MSVSHRGRTALPGVAGGALIAVGAVAALARTGAGSAPARFAGAAAAGVLLLCAYGFVRRRALALGVGFFLGLFWLVSAVALGLQGRLPPPATAGWVAWALALMLSSVLARPHARTDLHAQG